MRLYFEDPAGQRLAIDTDKKRYCAGAIPDYHRFIWVESETDLTIIGQELEFNGWAFDHTWIDEIPKTAAQARADPFHRGPRTRKEQEGGAWKTQ